MSEVGVSAPAASMHGASTMHMDRDVYIALVERNHVPRRVYPASYVYM